MVAPGQARGGRRRAGGVAVEPALNVVVVPLLGPEHPRQRLPHDLRAVRGELAGDDLGVELVGLAPAGVEDRLKLGPERPGPGRGVGQTQADLPRAVGGDHDTVPGGDLRPRPRRVDRAHGAMDDELVDPVLRVRTLGVDAPEAPGVGVVLGEEKVGATRAEEAAAPERWVVRLDAERALGRRPHGEPGARGPDLPRPGVPEPERRQQVQLGRLRTAVPDRQAHEDIVGRGLRVLDLDVEVPVLLEHAGVEQLELGGGAAPTAVFNDQALVRVGPLGVLVEPLHVRVGRGGVEVEVILLDVLAVVTLDAAEAEEAFLEDRVPAVPERQREAEPLVVVRDAGEPVLAPSVGARTRVVVGEGFPGRAVLRVVFAHRAPLAFAQVGAPALPVCRALARFLEPPRLGAGWGGGLRPSLRFPPRECGGGTGARSGLGRHRAETATRE